MKIFFDSSLTGRKDYEQNYKAIHEVLLKSEHEIVAAPVFTAYPEDVASESLDEAKEYYRLNNIWMKRADIIVLEVSYPSMGVGHLVSLGLQLGKPVVALHVPDKRPFLLEGIQDDRLQVVEYTLKGVQRTVVDAISYASDQQDTRFNFFISPKISNYLDWISKNKKIPRAVFLRRLIEADMDLIASDGEAS